jgi:phage protein D
MAFVSATALSRRPEYGGFYVPRFEITVSGEGFPQTALHDVVQVTYKDNVKEIDSFDLVVNNWDEQERAFKYIGSELAADLSGNSKRAQRFKLFEPCSKKVELKLGYGDQLSRVMLGNFTTMEPSFPSSGPPTLAVTGLNVLHRLRRKQYSYAWPRKTPAQIAREIGQLRDGKEKRFPIPIDVEPGGPEYDREIEYIAQDNQYDVDFLLNLARRYGYEVFIRQTKTGERLYFGPSQKAVPDEQIELRWGESLVEFRPTLTTANQLKSVTVRGWDRQKKAPIVATINVTDPDFKKLNPDLQRLITQCDPREERVVDLPVYTLNEAKAKARGLLLDRQRQFVKASVKTIGNPAIRAGLKLRITNVGSRLSGTYFVTETTHSLGAGRYVTEFKAQREEEKGDAS